MGRSSSAKTDAWLWLALLVGFSPVIAEFVRGFASGSSPPSTLLAPILIGVSLWRGAQLADGPRRAGLALIAAGLLFQLVGIATRTWTFAWLGLPIAVLGMSLWLGRPSWRVAALAFGLVPVPVSIEIAFTPIAETALLTRACAAWQSLGFAFSCTGPVARLGDRHLELAPSDVGWTLAAVLAQLGWFLAVREGASGPRALRRAVAFTAGAVVLQPLAIGLALGLLAVTSEAVARAWLAPGVWVASSAAVLLWSRHRAPAS